MACLGQLLGAPAVENCIRSPASSATIEGTVYFPANTVVRDWLDLCLYLARIF